MRHRFNSTGIAKDYLNDHSVSTRNITDNLSDSKTVFFIIVIQHFPPTCQKVIHNNLKDELRKYTFKYQLEVHDKERAHPHF